MQAQEICRYFLQGKCHFGDRCRYLHPASSGRGYSSNSSRHQGDPRTGRGWNQRGGNRFETFNTWQQSAGGRGQEGGGQNDSNFGFRQPRGGGYQPSWRGGRGGGRGGGGGGGGGWSDQGPGRGWSGTRTAGNVLEPTSPDEIVQVITADITDWTQSHMWPFSCYAYKRESSCLPGFTDLSPEELRWEAYKARAGGGQQAYLQTVQQLQERVMSVQREYLSVTAGDVQKLLSTTTAAPQSLFSTSPSGPKPQFSPTKPPTTSIFGTPQASSFGSKKTDFSQSIFGRPLPGNIFGTTGDQKSPSNVPTTAGDSVTQPADSSSHKPDATAHPLTEKERAAFKASHFTLGEIPETAPTPEFL